MTTIDPTDEDAEEAMEEAIRQKKRDESKYGNLLPDEGLQSEESND